MLSRIAVLELLLFAAVQTQPAAAQRDEDPRVVVRAATRAVQGDSAAALRARWTKRLARDSSDRAATLGLATIARLSYDYPAAERLYRRLLADSLHPDRYSPVARLGLARQLEGRGFSVEARPHFARAREEARAVGDAVSEGELLLTLSFIRARTEGVTVGEALLDTAGRLIPDTAFALRSQLHYRRAIMSSLRGGADALAEADSSIALARQAADVRAEADGFRVLGQVLVYRQQFDSALVVLRHAEDLFRRSRDRSALAASLVWRAQALGNLGRYGEMREAMRLALSEGQASNNPSAVATAYRSLGAIGVLMGDYAAAGENFNRATAISRETGDSLGVMTTRKFLADVALAAGDVAEARRLTLAQLAFARRMEGLSDQYEAHVMLAELAMRERDWASAQRSLLEAHTVLSRLPGEDFRLWLVHQEGRLAHARGDLTAADRAFTTFLRGVSARPNPEISLFDARVRLADIHATWGDLASAEREMVMASADLDRWRAGLGDAELRVLAFQVSPSQHARAADPAELDARVARVIAALAASGRGEVAFSLAERRRARELRDRLVRAEGVRAEERRTRRSGAAAAAADVREDPLSSTPRELIAQLPDDRTAFLEFVGGAGGAPITLFVLQRSGLRVAVLPADDSLGQRIARFAALLESGTDPLPLAKSLGATLLAPALSELGPRVTRLIIVPDRVLHYVPWDALRLPAGDLVAERFAVSVAPSASVMTALWRRSRSPEPADVRLLALGDPVFPDDGADDGESSPSAAAETFESAFDSTGGLPRLRASAEEARRVARYAPYADVRLRDDASAAFLKRASLRDYDVIHLATHALVDERSVARTALALAPGGGETGFIGAGDLAALDLEADLVVLSACRSARGKIVEGEGVQGLTAPLLQAGARAVIATGWRIADRSTVPFIDAFYRSLAEGLTVGDALRAAKLDAIRRGASPREWAAFTLVGDPLVTIGVRSPPPTRSLRGAMLALAALAIALVGYAYSRRTRRTRISDAR